MTSPLHFPTRCCWLINSRSNVGFQMLAEAEPDDLASYGDEFHVGVVNLSVLAASKLSSPGLVDYNE